MENKNTDKEASGAIAKALENEANTDASQKETQEERVSRNRAVFYWETPEYIHHEKDKKWYIIAASVILFFVLIGVFTGSLSMAVVFILLGGVYYINQLKKPKDVHVIISEMGIHFGHRFYPYNVIDSFWILYQPPHITTLNLKLHKGALRTISIELAEDISPGDLRDYLLTQVPELTGKEEDFIDTISRKLKL